MRYHGLAPGKFLATLLIAAASTLASPALAQEGEDPIEETQFWLEISAQKDLGDGFAISTQINPRIQLDDIRRDQLFLRLGVDYAASDFIRLGGGMITLGEYDPTEIRPYNYVDLGDGPLTFRTMAEYRFFEGADRMELRLRQRAQLAQPIAERTRFILSGEVFYTAIKRNRDLDPRITQWRAIAGINHRVDANLTMTAAYLALGSPRPDRRDGLAHIPTLILNYSF